MKRILVLLVLTSLYLLRFDFWNWQRPDLALGLPIGLAYHFAYCLAVSVVLALLLRLLQHRDPATDS